MGRTKALTTRATCDRVGIRKNNSYTNSKHYYFGRYYPKSGTIGLRLLPHDRSWRYEGVVCETLLHEVTHWAQYLFLEREEWYDVSDGWQGIPHPERLIERMAEEIARTWID